MSEYVDFLINNNAFDLSETERLGLVRRAWDNRQLIIDRLMFEYCPDEMTEDQMKEFEKNQVSAK